jgi:hypothetical protein
MEGNVSGPSGACYRVYFLDSGNRIFGVEELECKTDEDACGTARELGYTGGMEVWCGARLVARAARGENLVPGAGETPA